MPHPLWASVCLPNCSEITVTSMSGQEAPGKACLVPGRPQALGDRKEPPSLLTGTHSVDSTLG